MEKGSKVKINAWDTDYIVTITDFFNDGIEGTFATDEFDTAIDGPGDGIGMFPFWVIKSIEVEDL